MCSGTPPGGVALVRYLVVAIWTQFRRQLSRLGLSGNARQRKSIPGNLGAECQGVLFRIRLSPALRMGVRGVATVGNCEAPLESCAGAVARISRGTLFRRPGNRWLDRGSVLAPRPPGASALSKGWPAALNDLSADLAIPYAKKNIGAQIWARTTGLKRAICFGGAHGAYEAAGHARIAESRQAHVGAQTGR